MTLNQQQHLFSNDLSKFLPFIMKYAAENGYQIQLGEIRRTKEQQELYVKKGLSQRKDGLHLDSLAIDINLIHNGEFLTNKKYYKPLGDFWKELNEKNKWGGDYKSLSDPFHFERERE